MRTNRVYASKAINLAKSSKLVLDVFLKFGIDLGNKWVFIALKSILLFM